MMNMKPVEMQIAVPRTSEATRIQQDQQYRPLSDQALLAHQNSKEAEHNRKVSPGVDESGQNTVIKREKDHPSSQQDQSSHEQPTPEQDQEQKHFAEHPYKGKNIDFSL
jgi:hypothetical protein